MSADPGGPPGILVADDEAGFRELCVDLLLDTGYRAVAVADGEEALEVLAQTPFHIVLADLNMPVMDGLTLLKRVKTEYVDVEVVLMTAFGGLQSALEALRHGAYDYITKPFTRDLLVATVGRCVEKQRLAAELKRVQKELLEKDRLATLGSVSGWLAHRMRNPLNVILMCAQYLNRHFESADERREVAVAIEDKVKALERMTSEFIRFSRDYQPRLRPEDLRGIASRALACVAQRAQLMSVPIDTRFDDALPPVSADRELMEEVVGYMLDNAIEATQGEGRVCLKVTGAAQGVHLDVVNTGSFIPADTRRRLFTPFFTTKERGTGLGLAIARRVLESHGGEVYLKEGDPTTFRITLPAVQSNPAAEA